MKPKVFESGLMKTKEAVIPKNIPMFSDSYGNLLQDSGLSTEVLARIVHYAMNLIEHFQNTEVHVTQEDKIRWNTRESIDAHASREDIHITPEERKTWNEKESVKGAQAKANQVQSNLNSHIFDTNVHMNEYEKNKIKHCYTREEIDNLISQIEMGTDWKESVNTYSDLFTTYPDPEDGWTVNILDSNLTYRWDGSEWICISANYIPDVSSSVNGKMTSADKIKLDGIEAEANKYVHPNNPYIRHVTDAQIALWTSKADKDLATMSSDGLMSKEDYAKLFEIDRNANNYVHPTTHPASMIETNENNMFVSLVEKSLWNGKAPNVMATHVSDGQMSKEDKIKLDGISEVANYYVHPTTHPAGMIVQTDNAQFVSVNEKKTWNAKYGASNFIHGSIILNGVEGARIIHDLNDVNKNYTFVFTLTSNNSPEQLGNVYAIKGASDVTVYSSGNNIVDTIDYVIIVHPE